ncbi:13249_t:CDS:2 [Funneliformis mosseae]|uniref:13249_t:CDS:1 n=1 Tax=Funneliformis mosseae TaxID=27381 RepID=A0A9N8V2Q4_FUNMO|nr:13249_t:CDS:2 [Funneliformis mosseae]
MLSSFFSIQFVHRDDGLNTAFEIFIKNHEGQILNQFQDTYFGLCFGGCGIGKTELVTQFCMKMIKEYKNVLVLDLNNKFHSFDQNMCKDDQWLRLFLATVYFGRRKLKLSALLKRYYATIKCIEGTLCVVQLGNYNHSSIGTSIAAEQDVVLVPILSGIFGGNVKKTIIESQHSVKVLSTPPLSFDASICVLRISKEVLKQSPFKLCILIFDIGRVARLLMDFLESQMVNRVSECYSIVTSQGQQNIIILLKSALKELIRCIITGTLIYYGTQLSETEVTYINLNHHGIFHYCLLSNDQFVITMPWIWQDFERLEAYLKTLRTGSGTTIKEQFSHTYMNANVLKWKIEPCEQINPAINSHSSRRSGSKYIGLLKQTKHFTLKMNGKIFSSEVIKWYNNAMEKFNNARIFESIGFILFTNRNISKIDREKALAVYSNLIIICRDNLENYMSHTFLYRGFVNEEYRNEKSA